MKNQVLSIEQMQHLQELGVDTSKASMVLIAKDESGNEVCWEDLSQKEDTGIWLCESWDDELEAPCKKEAYLNYLDAEDGDYDHSYRKDCGVFTLQDILELLPSEIEYIDGETHYLSFCKESIQYSYQEFEDEWVSVICDSNGMRMYSKPQYSEGISCITFNSPRNLLGCAYEMLCWCAENGYLKGGKK